MRRRPRKRTLIPGAEKKLRFINACSLPAGTGAVLVWAYAAFFSA
jgi:hypothetical protein